MSPGSCGWCPSPQAREPWRPTRCPPFGTRCVVCPGCCFLLRSSLLLQGTRDLNPQPSVLETDALPVELVPSDGSPAHDHPVGGQQQAGGRTTSRRVYG